LIPRQFAYSVYQRLWAPAVLLCAAIVAATYAQYIHSSLKLHEAALLPIERVGQIAVWLTAALLFNRLLEMLLWNGIVRRTLGRTPPRLIIQLTSVVVFLMAISAILRFVFGESVTAIWAASGAIGLVIGLALRNLILDTFSGLAIHLERPFKVGDWINCHTRMGPFIGKVEETNWRTTRLWTTSRNMVIIPNSFLTTTLITNYSMPGTVSRFEMDFVLDFSVSAERALRILSAALVSTIGSSGVLAAPPPKVRVNGTTEHGVQYRLRYYLEPAEVSPSKARNAVTQAVLKHIAQAGLTLPYPRRDLFLARMPWRNRNWSFLKDQIRQLKSVSLFSSMDDDELEFIAKHMSVHSLDRGSVIVKQGEQGSSMFLLAEGLLEVLITKADGTEVKVAELAPGTFFGEKSLLTGEPRSATVITVAESVVCEITKNCIASLFELNPDLADTLGRAVVERDLQNELLLSRATKEEVNAKVSSVVGKFVEKMKLFFGQSAKQVATSG